MVIWYRWICEDNIFIAIQFQLISARDRWLFLIFFGFMVAVFDLHAEYINF